MWKLINDPSSAKHRWLHRHLAVARTFADQLQINIDDIIRDFDKTRGSDNAANYQIGVWQFIMLPHTKRKKNERVPSDELRRTLVKFDDAIVGSDNAKRVNQLGVTTTWAGEYRIRNEFTFVRFIENIENQEMALILERPTTRRIKGVPSYQRGICLGVAFGQFDHPRGPIVSGRCVLRRLDVLSDSVRKNPDIFNDELKATFCGYRNPALLQNQEINLDDYSGLSENDRAVSEQYLGIRAVLETLEENQKNGNFGSRIFLRD